jgi:penicillin-binding protein 1A
LPPNSFAKPSDAGPPSPRRGGLRLWPALGAVFATLMVAAFGGWVAIDRAYLSDLPPIPDESALWSQGRPRGVTFLGPDGEVVAYRGPRHGRRVQLSELPAHVPLAFLAAEDRRFYEHGALDIRGIARASLANARAGRAVEGGSTISQQLARTLFLKPDKTFKRKVQEAALAARLERVLTKDQILELYLNRIYFGDGAYGLSAAARRYFDKDPRELTLSEAALLAALPKAPSRLALSNDLPAAWARAQLILDAMRETEWIEPAQRLAAARPELAPPAASPEGDMAWALDAAAREADMLVGAAAPDLVVRITVDPKLQATAARVVRANLGGSRQAALVALGPDGAVRALIGGRDHSQSPFNRATQARRQPGSAFKPIVWAAALERGVAPYDVRIDRAVSIDGWNPQNYGGGHRGAVSVEQALRLSLNTISVGLVREMGVERVAEVGRRFGLADLPAKPGPSIALGAYEVSLLDLTSAYQVLQNAGGRAPPHLVTEITNARGDVLFSRTPSAPLPVYPQYQAGQMVRMMEGVITSGTGTRAAIGRPAAGKTGTSQNYRDAWFVGFTPDFVAGVWVGHDDNRAMRGVTGGETPALIWKAFMSAAHQGLPVRDFDWAEPLAPPPPPEWFYDPYGEDYYTAGVDGYAYEPEPYDPYAEGPDYTYGYGRDEAPWTEAPPEEPRRSAEGPAFSPGYGRARRPSETFEGDAEAYAPSRPRWSPSVPF